MAGFGRCSGCGNRKPNEALVVDNECFPGVRCIECYCALFGACRTKLDKAEGVIAAASVLAENMCQSCLIDGERNPATGRTYTNTCGHRKKLRAALKALAE